MTWIGMMSDDAPKTRIANDVGAALRNLLPASVRTASVPVRDAVADLFAEETGYIANAVEKRRFEFSTGRLIARRLIADQGGDPTAIPVGDHRCPIWPKGVRGSISHSSGICAAAIARDDDVAAIGIDVESVADVSLDIIDTIAPVAEFDRNRGVIEPDLLPAALFSIKEAVFKAYYPATQTYLAHHDVAVTLAEGAFTAQIMNPDRPALLGNRSIAGAFAFAGDMVVSTVAIRAFDI